MLDKKRIALIDDNLLVLDLYGKKIRQADFEVFFATNGREGYEKILKERPHLVVTDLVMPKKDGFFLIEKVKKNENLKDIPVIAFSNLNHQEDIDEAKRMGADEYFYKGDTAPNILISKINQILGA